MDESDERSGHMLCIDHSSHPEVRLGAVSMPAVDTAAIVRQLEELVKAQKALAACLAEVSHHSVAISQSVFECVARAADRTQTLAAPAVHVEAPVVHVEAPVVHVEAPVVHTTAPQVEVYFDGLSRGVMFATLVPAGLVALVEIALRCWLR